MTAGGAEAAVRTAAGLQDEDDATRQPARLQASRRRPQVDPPALLSAGVPPETSAPAAVRRALGQRRARPRAGVEDARGVD